MTPDLEHLTPVLGAVGGCGLATVIARHFILKSLKDLEHLASQISGISGKLAGIEVKLERLDKLHDLTTHHDRKITAIESRLIYERPPNLSGHDKKRMQTQS